MASKSFTEIVQDMIGSIFGRKPDIDTAVGTVTRDVLIEPTAEQLEDLYAENERVSYLHSLFHYDKMTDTELDRLVYNWGITRKAGTSAVGYVQFRKSQELTQDIVIPSGTMVSTKKGTDLTSVSFLTTEEKIMYLSQQSTYYNSTTGFYEITVPIQCTEAGATGNISANSITVLQSVITGINNINNSSATTNGIEVESSKDLASRALIALTGNSVGTEDGYISKILENSLVFDALLVDPQDPLQRRGAGAIDIYVFADIDNTLSFSEATNSFVFALADGTILPSESANDYFMENQPTKSIVSITGSDSGALIEGTDFIFVADETSAFSKSINALDKIHWLGTKPTAGETITIKSYYYNLLQDLTDFIEPYRNVTANLLIKLAKRVRINVSMMVKPDNTISDTQQFKSNIQQLIINFLTTTELANIIEQADIVGEVKAFAGVDNIRLPITALNTPDKSEYLTGVQDITLGKNEYMSPNTITVEIF